LLFGLDGSKWQKARQGKMPVPNCEIDGTSVVLVGSFNPAIFHPSWFSEHDIIRKGLDEKATLQVASPEVTSFTLDWLNLQVTRDRFQAIVTDAQYAEPLRDFVVSTFTFLEHTPIHQMGINRDQHFLSDKEHMDKLGDLLAPKTLWQKVLDDPLLQSLTILAKRAGSNAKYFRVTVQSSLRLLPRPGVYIGTNEHFEMEARGAGPFLEVLVRSWRGNMDHAKKVAEHLMTQIGE
jgi:hypothetical protein